MNCFFFFLLDFFFFMARAHTRKVVPSVLEAFDDMSVGTKFICQLKPK